MKLYASRRAARVMKSPELCFYMLCAGIVIGLWLKGMV